MSNATEIVDKSRKISPQDLSTGLGRTRGTINKSLKSRNSYNKFKDSKWSDKTRDNQYKEISEKNKRISKEKHNEKIKEKYNTHSQVNNVKNVVSNAGIEKKQTINKNFQIKFIGRIKSSFIEIPVHTTFFGLFLSRKSKKMITNFILSNSVLFKYNRFGFKEIKYFIKDMMKYKKHHVRYDNISTDHLNEFPVCCYYEYESITKKKQSYFVINIQSILQNNDIYVLQDIRNTPSIYFHDIVSSKRGHYIGNQWMTEYNHKIKIFLTHNIPKSTYNCFVDSFNIPRTTRITDCIIATEK